MALEMRDRCEHCHTPLARDGEAWICVYECTFCHECSSAMRQVCRNCGGELVRRPRAKPQSAPSDRVAA
jgi:hypothetical protein